ncbi:acyl-CoA Delta-9 desaturase-like [Leptopilina boulardi]|uniref:acyl-CoA Delta-9 desaturase-like n=1 Tax=Leptopilina boulardi TaxID=63433 RepID=UPI0021F56B58|nr:acyl-CoA Delta-9 desaturase-like [Leptopilina boulardi]
MNTSDKVTIETRDSKKFSLKEEWDGWIKHLNWPFTIFHVIFNIIAVYGILTFPYASHKLTLLWAYFYYIYTGAGITIGAHRFWTHRAYKAKLPLKILLAGGYYGSGMFRLRQWIKLHRIHHKYTDTDADPHNIKRGFWFAHIGWFLLPKHPEFTKRLKEIDMSDINADPVVNFGDKYFLIVTIMMTFIFPTLVPVMLWNETWYCAIMSQCFMRYMIVLNATCSVNSVAHMFGSKPYDRTIRSTDTKFVQIFTLGEGWHNFHHVFPWDYRAGEIAKIDFNFGLYVINQFKKIGWAYDCKVASNELIRKVAEKRGDGNYELWKEVPEEEYH